MKTLISAVVAGIVVGVLSQSAGADTIRISVSSGYAPTAAWVHEFQEVFVPTVDAKLAESGAHEIDWNFCLGNNHQTGWGFRCGAERAVGYGHRADGVSSRQGTDVQYLLRYALCLNRY